MTRRAGHARLCGLALVGMALVFAALVVQHDEATALGPLAADYVRLSVTDLAIPNVTTAILLAYRSFDTLGEVAVLFMVAASLKPLLAPLPETIRVAAPRLSPTPGEIVESGHQALLPLIAVFGAYVVLFGHLSAGGGFQGGAIIATGVAFFMLARVATSLPLDQFSAVESLAGLGVIALGLAGLVWAGGFLDPRILPPGEFGALISGGAIPIFSLLLGVKVAAELSVVLERFRA